MAGFYKIALPGDQDPVFETDSHDKAMRKARKLARTTGNRVYIHWGQRKYEEIMEPPRKKNPEIPKHQIEFIVGRMHVGTSDDEIRKDIRMRVATARTPPGATSGWTQSMIKKAENYAVKVHHDNQKLYAGVMGGSGMEWRGRKPNPLPAGRSKSCHIRRLRNGRYQVRL